MNKLIRYTTVPKNDGVAYLNYNQEITRAFKDIHETLNDVFGCSDMGLREFKDLIRCENAYKETIKSEHDIIYNILRKDSAGQYMRVLYNNQKFEILFDVVMKIHMLMTSAKKMQRKINRLNKIKTSISFKIFNYRTTKEKVSSIENIYKTIVNTTGGSAHNWDFRTYTIEEMKRNQFIKINELKDIEIDGDKNMLWFDYGNYQFYLPAKFATRLAQFIKTYKKIEKMYEKI